MESPTAVMSEPSLDADESVYPCKGCGEILEEGKAFELAGNRWHIDCFRCNTCGVLLDSDANLLLLGDGSLICNNCTYSCHSCGNKIEDLAILTGDLAYCAQCFKCRNCKRKIENLRYAKTSQGIFCMQCHETLMARRRKKARANATQPQRAPSSQSNGSGGAVVLDKSLPALPPSVAPTNALARDGEPPATNRSTPVASRNDSYSSNYKSDLSPSSFDSQKENVMLPASTYNDSRSNLHESDISLGFDDSPFIPIALDTGAGSPFSQSRRTATPEQTQSTKKDYFDGVKPPSHREDLGAAIAATSSRSSSKDRTLDRGQPRARQSPHVSLQDKGRRSYTDVADPQRRGKESAAPTTTLTMPPALGGSERSRGLGLSPSEERQDPVLQEPFRLQEAPKERPASTKGSGAASPETETSPSMNLASQTTGSPIVETGVAAAPASAPAAEPPRIETSQPKEYSRTPFRKSPRSPASGSSSEKSGKTETTPLPSGKTEKSPVPTGKASVPARKEVPTDATIKISHERKQSASGSTSKPVSKAVETVKKVAPDFPPARSPNRPVSAAKNESNDFTSPREAPPRPGPPGGQGHKLSESLSSLSSDITATPKYPSTPPLGSSRDMFADDEVRDLPGEDDEQGGIFRRVSKAVKHGRSQSDKATHHSPKWTRTPRNGSLDISSPTAATPDTKEEGVELRNKLKFAQQKIAELEAEKSSLEEKINGTVDIRQVNTELREKRSTMAFLDTQREMVVRELEVMTEHLTRVKDSNRPLNLEGLKSDVMRDFAASLHKLKENLGAQIEDLVHKKNELTSEISNLIQMKDKGFQEYESLSTKNAQLVELNHSLVQNIQELYKQGRQPNGLGIYTQGKSQAEVTADLNRAMSADGSASHLSGDTAVESAEVLHAPQVVNIRKGQVKKFNWKKGGQSITKGMKQGLRDAFGSERHTPLREEYFQESSPYGALPAGEAPLTGSTPLAPSKGGDGGKPGWGGFLSAQRGQLSKVPSGSGSAKDSREASVTHLPADTTIFGSDLTARADFERRVVPAIVTRCIEEVESRGMDQEGIYRKSGSSTVVKSIQQGFEKDVNGYNEISDPDLDIHAVTGCLKQYFRKLPNPLITFECYDGLLESAGGAEPMGAGERLGLVRECVDSLPRTHRDTLEFLLQHLARVMEQQDVNLMTPLNIAVVFAPTIMRPSSIEREMSDMQAQRTAVQYLLEQHRGIFGSTNGDASSTD